MDNGFTPRAIIKPIYSGTSINNLRPLSQNTYSNSPISNLEPQILNTMPIPIGTILVDDPVALVDDPNTLTGSQTTQIKSLGENTANNAPQGSIEQRR